MCAVNHNWLRWMSALWGKLASEHPSHLDHWWTCSSLVTTKAFTVMPSLAVLVNWFSNCTTPQTVSWSFQDSTLLLFFSPLSLFFSNRHPRKYYNSQDTVHGLPCHSGVMSHLAHHGVILIDLEKKNKKNTDIVNSMPFFEAYFKDCVCVMMTGTTKLYILIPLGVTLTFTQSHRVMKKLNLCSHSVLKWHEVAQTYTAVDYLRR